MHSYEIKDAFVREMEKLTNGVRKSDCSKVVHVRITFESNSEVQTTQACTILNNSRKEA